jgi:hypothetical protein
MNRFLLMGLGVVAAVGFALSWAILGPPPPAPVAPLLAKIAETLATRTHTFALLPADIRADRETPAIAADARGNVFLAWASQTGELERTLFLTRSTDGGANFATPVAFRRVPIHKKVSKMNGKERTFSTHVLPRLVTLGDALYLGWVEAIDGGPRVEYRIARSTNAGKTFGAPVPAHGDDAGRPGYTALSAGPDGRLVTAWLDGRNHGQQPYVSVADASCTFAPETLAYEGGGDKGVCPCCDVAAARAANGTTLVALRDSASGYRDIVVARANASGFDAPVPVSAEHWTFQGCPHDGPSLALAGETVHVAWMDAHNGKRRVHIAASPMAKLAFQARELAPDRPGEQAHPRLLSDGEGTLHAVWDEGSAATLPAAGEHAHGAPPAGATRAIVYSSSRDGGKTFAPARAVAPTAAGFQTQPALAVDAKGNCYFTWVEITSEGKRIVFAAVPRSEKPTEP